MEITTERTGLRGRMERKRAEYVDLARAYQVVLTDMDLDDRRNAMDAAPKKFLQAMNHRAANGMGFDTDAARQLPPAPKPKRKKSVWKSASERIDEIRTYLAAHPGASMADISEALKVNKNTVFKYVQNVATFTKEKTDAGVVWRYFLKGSPKAKAAKTSAKAAPVAHKKRSKKRSPIHGKVLSLFLLEHMNGIARTSKWFTEELAKAGSPLRAPQAINGPLNAALVKQGWAKRDGEGYLRTEKGAQVAQELRLLLEASGAVPKGGYLQ
jgi:hypothetical protein